MNFTDKQLAALVIIGLGVGWYMTRKASQVAGKVAEGLNPVSSGNWWYTGASEATSAITGDQRSLGSQVYDWFNDEQDFNGQ